MAAKIIDGKAIAAKYREEIATDVEKLKKKGPTPCLAVILVGEDAASLSYVKAKQKALVCLGMEGRDFHLENTVTEAELLSLIARLNCDTTIHGILVQLPLPAHIYEQRVLGAINPAKDVDCFHPLSVGKLFLDQSGFLPCTPAGIVFLLSHLKIPLSGANTVIVGRSNIVGKPLAILLSRKEHNATITLCHTRTADLGFHTRNADILIAAAGKAGLIKADMIKKGTVVIDVGVNRVPDNSAKGYSLRGDVVFEQALELASWITPVPGGVGPLTITMLMRNLLIAAESLIE